MISKLTDKDKKQLKDKGISQEKFGSQLETFQKGIPYVNLLAAATIDDGILKFNYKQKAAYVELFDKQKDELDLLKFVPASGAATRMF